MHTLEEGWPKHWCSSPPAAFLLQEAPELLSTSQSQDFGVYVRLESCSALLLGCCLNQEGMEFLLQVSGRDWPLLQCQICQVQLGSPRSDPRCARAQDQREMFPGTGGNGTGPRRASGPCPGERAESVDHHVSTAHWRGLVGCVRRKLHSQMYLHSTGLIL